MLVCHQLLISAQFPGHIKSRCPVLVSVEPGKFGHVQASAFIMGLLSFPNLGIVTWYGVPTLSGNPQLLPFWYAVPDTWTIVGVMASAQYQGPKGQVSETPCVLLFSVV